MSIISASAHSADQRSTGGVAIQKPAEFLDYRPQYGGVLRTRPFLTDRTKPQSSRKSFGVTPEGRQRAIGDKGAAG
jgi:hypothetical protein